MNEELTDDLVRELYARFGSAYYHSECLHRGLCIILALSSLPRRDLITRPRVEERLAYAFSLTLGDITGKLQGVLPAEQFRELQQVVDKRNFLAHHFWFDRAHLMSTVENIHQLIDELDRYRSLFNRLDEQTSRWSETKLRELGITDEMIHERQHRILSGQIETPLPDTRTVRELEKKLKRRQRLIRVWEFTLDDGKRSLVFELVDGSLWQLCDVGFGWTRAQVIGPNWTEHPAIKPYLPADILPRPKDAKPWDYQFSLSNGAVLWVKPARQEQTFKWGVRTSKESTEQGATPDGNSAALHCRR